ncbi:unnamed protein product [Choristocarpus tenellus]
MNFGKRDLALLSDTIGDADTLRFTRDDSELSGPQETLIPRRDPSKKIHIYRAGQAPGWVHDEEQAGQVDSLHSSKSGKGKAKYKAGRDAAMDAQLARLSLQNIHGRGKQDGEHLGKRAVHEAQVMQSSDSESDSDGPVFGGRSDDEGVEGDVIYRPTSEAADAGQVEEDEDDDAIAARRARVRERLRARRATEAEVLEVELEEPTKPEDSDSSEWETDTDVSQDEKDPDGEQVLKPVFVPKAKRETAIERERQRKEEEEKQRKRNIQNENRKRETRQLAAEVVQREEEMTENHLEDNESEGGAPDDDDDMDEELAYEEWKVRELGRVRKEKEEKERLVKEKEDTERRRAMTDDQRRLEDAMMGKNQEKDKGKIKFMQKYYHKGAFYMDEESVKMKDDVRRRSYHEPTLEDKFDKTQMPRVMQASSKTQVKKFGRSGQTKWTHLANEDTTQRDSAWAQETHMATKMQHKMSGVGDIDNAFKRRKKVTMT